ncbi:MAG: hypothetical protein KDK89_07835 [Alphaproteobacteria bacterium]|nr:hypothetical protein [Alphaproteobacteria bacterium]
MNRIIKTLFDRKRNQPTPEEIEAMDRANRALQWRVAQMSKLNLVNGKFAA